MDAFHRLHLRRLISPWLATRRPFSRPARLSRRRHRSGCRRSPFPPIVGCRVGTDNYPPHSHNVHARWHLSSKERNVLPAQFDPRGKKHATVFRNCVAFGLVRAGSQKFKMRAICRTLIGSADVADAARGLRRKRSRSAEFYLWALNFGMDLRPSRAEGFWHGADTRSHQMPTLRFTDESRVGSRRQEAALSAVLTVRGARPSQGRRSRWLAQRRASTAQVNLFLGWPCGYAIVEGGQCLTTTPNARSPPLSAVC